MANTCYTQWIFEGNKQDIDALFDVLEKVSQNEYTELIERFDYSKKYLGNLVAYFGRDPKEIKCSGIFTNYEIVLPAGYLSVDTETDWNDMLETWEFVCQHYPSIKMYYHAEENAASGTWTNDVEGKYFSTRMEIRVEEDPEEFTSYEEGFARLSEIIGKPVTMRDDYDKMVDEYNQSHPDEDFELQILIIELCEPDN